jgi:hypothetical protein
VKTASVESVGKILFWSTVVLVVGDILTTTYVVHRWGSTYESNMIMRWAFEEYGLMLPMMLKLIASMCLVWWLVLGYMGKLHLFYRMPIVKIALSDPKSAEQLSMIFFAVTMLSAMFMAGIVFNNLVCIKQLIWGF